MKIQLTDIDAKSPFHRKLTFASHELNSSDREVQLSEVVFDLEIQVDPVGYVARYAFQAIASTSCVRCGELVQLPIQERDWIALRFEQPSEHQVVLQESDMNTKFLNQPELDVDHFVDEVMDLEVPEFPRHADGECEGFGNRVLSDTPKNRPFADLAHLLNEPEEKQGED